MPVLDGVKLIENRIEAIRAFHKNASIIKAELDLSGGIDSAVMAWLLVRALGPENVLLVHTRINTDYKQTDRASRLAQDLKATFVNVDLTGLFDMLSSQMMVSLGGPVGTPACNQLSKRCKEDPTILGSIRSTLRAPVGRGFNRMFGGGIRHGTGNECEDRYLRFYQKGGDGEVDTNPLEMLSKTEIFQLAYTIAETERGTPLEGIFRELITVKPSPDLWGKGDTHNDEDELQSWTGVSFTYGKVDPLTGDILEFGTIERVSRLLDQKFEVPNLWSLGLFPEGTPVPFPTTTCGEVLFKDDLHGLDTVLDCMALIADKTGIFRNTFFPGTSRRQIRDFLLAARKAERQTRHKGNGNIPTLGTRSELVEAGILTDKLTVKG